jgi:hypothetical protein
VFYRVRRGNEREEGAKWYSSPDWIFTSGKRGGRSFDLVDPVVVGGEDPDIVRDFLAARELAAACQAGTASPGDIAAAFENLTEIHDYLVEDRRPL